MMRPQSSQTKIQRARCFLRKCRLSLKNLRCNLSRNGESTKKCSRSWQDCSRLWCVLDSSFLFRQRSSALPVFALPASHAATWCSSWIDNCCLLILASRAHHYPGAWSLRSWSAYGTGPERLFAIAHRSVLGYRWYRSHCPAGRPAWIDWPSAPPSTAAMCLMYNLLLIASSLCWRRLSGGNDPHRPFPSPIILPFCLLLTARNCLER